MIAHPDQIKTLKEKETPQKLASIPLNEDTSELKQLLADTNAIFQTFLQGLSPTTSTDYSVRKAAKKPNRPQIIPTHFGQHEGHGHERTLKKRKHSQTI
jgi:hypothetical protein